MMCVCVCPSTSTLLFVADNSKWLLFCAVTRKNEDVNEEMGGLGGGWGLWKEKNKKNQNNKRQDVR